MPIPDDIPSRLYKYFAPKCYVERVIRGEAIQFTCPLDFNDPFECRYRIKYGGRRRTVEMRFRKVAKQMFPKAPLAERAELASAVAAMFAKGYVYAHELPYYEDLIKRWGVLSLSERHESVLMWSHYAENHQGICIGFDTDRDFFGLAGQVAYREEMPFSDLLTRTGEGAERILEAALLTKSTDWSYEREWRVLKSKRPLEEIGEITADAFDKGFDEAGRRALAAHYGPGRYPFEPSAVAEIIFGLRTAPEFEARVRGWVRDTGSATAFYRAIYVRGEYRLERVPA
jgi:hypothetical protein